MARMGVERAALPTGPASAGDELLWVVEYGYDAVTGRLESVTWDEGGGPVLTESYAYDDNGNRLAWSVDPDGPIGPLPMQHYAGAVHDDRDRLVSYVAPDGVTTVAFTYDQAGRLATRSEGAATTRYRYDALGNLLEVELPDGTLVTYQVDALGRRVARSVDGVVESRWVYRDGLDPIAELDASGAVRRVYAYGTSPFSPDLVVDAATGTVERVVRDHLGSPRALVDVATGTSSSYTFDGYGNVRGSAPPGGLGYTGGLYDPLTGLVRLGARDYDPVVGRWTAPDPALWGGGQANLYEYVAGDPLGYVDPTGRNAAAAPLVVAFESVPAGGAGMMLAPSVVLWGGLLER